MSGGATSDVASTKPIHIINETPLDTDQQPVMGITRLEKDWKDLWNLMSLIDLVTRSHDDGKITEDPVHEAVEGEFDDCWRSSIR